GASGDAPTLVNWYDPATGVLDSTATATDTTRYTYDAIGRVLTVSDPEHHLTTITYADTSRFRNVESATTGGRTTRFRYDAYGRVAAVTGPDERVTQYAYDALNRSVRVTTADQGQTVYTWGALFLDRVTDPRQQVYSWTRNGLGLVEREVRPGDSTGVSLTTRYDRYGRPTALVNRRGQTVSVTYDTWDRVATRTADGQTTTFGYSADDPAHPDGPGWVSVSNPESTDTVRFDGKGQVTDAVTVRTILGAAQRYAVQPHYDTYGRMTGMGVATPAGRDSIEYGYDPSTFQLDAMRDLAGGLTYFGYNRDGMLATRTLPGGTSITNSYTATHMLGGLRYSNSMVNSAAGVLYRYDALDRIIERRDPESDSIRAYEYDPNGRWLSRFTDEGQSGATEPVCSHDRVNGFLCTGPEPAWTVARADTFAYDLTENPTNHGAAVGAGNRLSRYGGYTLTYDLDGNLATKTGNGVTQSFVWNSLGQLSSVTTNGVVVSYFYDGLGRRVRKTVSFNDYYFVYMGSTLLMDLSAYGIQAKYTYYPGSDQPHSVTRGGSTWYYGTDVQGSVLALFNATGSVVNRYAYHPFGETLRASESASVPNRIRYAGREYESESGLYYNNARWYDPSLHRFISEDPAGLQGGGNLYTYTGNDPVNYSDPTGLSQECVSGYGGNTHTEDYTFTYRGQLWYGRVIGAYWILCPAGVLGGAPFGWGGFGPEGPRGGGAGGGGGGDAPAAGQTPRNLPQCNDPSKNRSRFFQQLPGLRDVARRVDVPEDYVVGLASYESDWLNDHNYALHNLWGLTQAGGRNLSFPSFQAGNDYFVQHIGPSVRGSSTVPEFVAALRRHGYNSVNPNYDSTLTNRINNIPKWEAACGVK
ncbi:MAG TPA: RHS repeat-associated core domain-containing protein, partial [Longimicrobium sp.]|nr:RHS repeat-associated core domain-containing protein [Longimicrobium sp.]